jgi:hypothetical protein
MGDVLELQQVSRARTADAGTDKKSHGPLQPPMADGVNGSRI